MGSNHRQPAARLPVIRKGERDQGQLVTREVVAPAGADVTLPFVLLIKLCEACVFEDALNEAVNLARYYQ